MKNTIYKFALLATILLFSSIWVKAQIVNVTDFGVNPNTFEDVTEGVKNAINKCKEQPGSTLVFPTGRYDFWTDKAEKREYFISNTSSEIDCPSKLKNVGLLLDNMNGITIEGNGSLFVFHGKTITFAINESNDVKLQNITIDFERPSMSEARIGDLTPNSFTLSIHPDSKYTIIDNKLRFYGEGWSMSKNYFGMQVDTIAKMNLYTSWEPVLKGKATELEPFKVKVEYDMSNTSYMENRIMTMRDHVRDHVGLFVNKSKNVTLNNVTMHYMHGLGIISQFSENLTYRRVAISPSRGRAIAAFADGMHFSGCRGHIEISECLIRGLHDDPINVHGTYLNIAKIHSPQKVTMRFMHHQTYGMQPFVEGDTVAFIKSETLRTVDHSTVKSIERISDREYMVELTKPLSKEIIEGDCLENMTWTPSLHVKDCLFEMTNARGILISTPKKVIIEDNYFNRVGMYGILIAGDANSWYESGAVNDVLIRNNYFDACAYNFLHSGNNYAISIEPEDHKQEKGHWVHRNIDIRNNVFKVYRNNLILRAKSTKGLSFENNSIENTDFVPNLKGKEQGELQNAPFKLENCSNVKIKGNNYKLNKERLEVECLNMTKKDIEVSKTESLKMK